MRDNLSLSAPADPGKAGEAPRRINVLFVLYCLDVGGAEKQVASLVNGLDASRYALSLMGLKPGDDLLGQIHPDRCENRIWRLGVGRNLDLRAVRQLARRLDEDRVDVVIATNMYPLVYGWLARMLSRRKPQLVEVFHTTTPRTRKDRLSMLVYKPLVRMTQLLVYVSHGQARYWRGRGLRARREAVIHNGIDVRRFSDVWSAEEKAALRRRHGFAPQDYVVGLCALMRPEKAHSDLLAALARLRREGTAVKSLLIGGGFDQPRIEAEIRDLGLSDHVRITGIIEDVRASIAVCDVMVIVSTSVETFSIAALEGMALGKPLVMSDIGGASEQVTPGVNGLLFPAGDVGALTDRLRRLADPQLRAGMGRRATARVAEEFSVEAMVRAYDSALAELVSRSARTERRARS